MRLIDADKLAKRLNEHADVVETFQSATAPFCLLVASILRVVGSAVQVAAIEDERA